MSTGWPLRPSLLVAAVVLLWPVSFRSNDSFDIVELQVGCSMHPRAARGDAAFNYA